MAYAREYERTEAKRAVSRLTPSIAVNEVDIGASVGVFYTRTFVTAGQVKDLILTLANVTGSGDVKMTLTDGTIVVTDTRPAADGEMDFGCYNVGAGATLQLELTGTAAGDITTDYTTNAT